MYLDEFISTSSCVCFILACKHSFVVHLVSGTGSMLDSEGMANLSLRYITLHTSSKLHDPR